MSRAHDERLAWIRYASSTHGAGGKVRGLTVRLQPTTRWAPSPSSATPSASPNPHQTTDPHPTHAHLRWRSLGRAGSGACSARSGTSRTPTASSRTPCTSYSFLGRTLALPRKQMQTRMTRTRETRASAWGATSAATRTGTGKASWTSRRGDTSGALSSTRGPSSIAVRLSLACSIRRTSC